MKHCPHAHPRIVGKRNTRRHHEVTLECPDCGIRFVRRTRRRFYGDAKHTTKGDTP